MRTPVPVIVPTRAPLLMRPLEPRILLDAATGETALAVANEAAHSALAEVFVDGGLAEAGGESATWTRAIRSLEHNPPYIPEFVDIPDEQSSEIAFVTHDVPDIDALLGSLPSHVEVVVLDAESDGISQMVEALEYRTDIDAIHIFSHGSSGALALGGASLTSQTMVSNYADGLDTIGRSLVQSGDILLYGCDFASGDLGREAVETLARLTGADIAASIDATGHWRLGGDWELETSSGEIEAAALSADDSWMGALPAQTLVAHEVPVGAIDDDEAIGSNRTVGQSFTYDSGSATYQVDQIDLMMRVLGGPPWQNATIAIRDTFAGADIASGTINATALSGTYQWSSISLDSPAVLNSNQSYVFVVYANHPSQTIEVGTEDDLGYPGGTFIDSDGTPSPGDDMLFRLVDSNGNSDPVITSGNGLFYITIDADENQTAVTTVTATDADPGDSLTYSIIGAADAGLFSIDSVSGELVFNVAPNFFAPGDADGDNVYEVDIQVSDGNGGVDIQQIDVWVNNINDAPTVLNDSFTVAEDGSISVDVLFNDSDDDGDPLTITHVEGQVVADGGLGVTVANGVVQLFAGELVFTPAPNYNGPASFTYTVSDGNGGTATGAVSGTVTPTNDAPAATNNIYTTGGGTPVSGNVITGNTGAGVDSDPDGDTLSLAPGSVGTFATAQGGLITLFSDGDFAYTPAAGFSGSDTFIYTVSDGALSDTATLTFNVASVNENPVARSNVYSGVEDGGDVVGNVLADDTGAGVDYDLDGGTLQVTGFAISGIAGSFNAGDSALISGIGLLRLTSSGAFTFSPVINYNGVVPQVTYTIADGQGGSAASTLDVAIAAVNDAPVSTGGSMTTLENEPVVILTSAFGYTDVEGDTLQSVTIDNMSLAGGRLTHSNGTVVVTDGMTLSAAQLADLTFEPALDSAGTVSFDYTVNDSDSGVRAGSMIITVSAASNPVAGPDIDLTPETEDEPETESEEEPEAESEDQPVPAPPSTTSTAPAPAAPPKIVLPKPQEPVVPVFQKPEPVVELLPQTPIEPQTTAAPPSISAKITNYGFEPINRDIFNDSLEQTGDDIRRYDGLLGTTSAKVTFAFGAAIGVGGVSWLLQSGILAATLLSALPAWKRFDPIAIVSGHRDTGEDDELSDVEMMMKSVRDAGARAGGRQTL